MKVIRGLSTDKNQPLTSPFRSKSGIFIELRGGDYLCPIGEGSWFSPPYFAKVSRRYFSRAWLPFVSIRIGSWGCYFGAKAYGADSDAYKNFMDEKDVYVGSTAIMKSARMSTKL